MAIPTLSPLPPDKGSWDEHALNRRGFLEALFGIMAGTGAVIAVVPGVRFLVGKSLEPGASKWVELGKVADLATATVTLVNYSIATTDAWRDVTQRGTVYVYTADGGKSFTAIDGTCTHLGCIVQWKEGDGRFICPCHSGAFTREGAVISGPPPQPLRQLAVKIDNGTLMAEI